jgi:DNA-binding transcriptional MocR family regulator
MLASLWPIGLPIQSQFRHSGSYEAAHEASMTTVVPLNSALPSRRIGPRELARLLGEWATPGQPAYAALAARVRLLVLDGRLPVGVRLPPERELAAALSRSRTTAAAAYDLLRESGYAASRQGSGTWTTLPGDAAEVPAWAPEPVPAGVVDLAHAAPSAPPQLHAAYAAALDELPRYLPGTGYDYRGVPVLRERLAERFTARGLPTTPDQILITSGALQAVRLALSMYVGAGDRVLVEQPGYPGGLDIVADLGARAVPVPVHDGWGGLDSEGLVTAVRQTAPRAAYLIPDFQNPTGALLPEDQRGVVAQALAEGRTAAVIDESLVELSLESDVMPTPFGSFVTTEPIVTVGSASKLFWGGLRIGWLRSDSITIRRLAALRARLDLSSPILEQLACADLMDQLELVRADRRSQLRTQRDALVAAMATHLPGWRYRLPGGGQVLWCELPSPASGALAAAAADRGLRVTPGSRFAADGTLESWIRLPYTRPVEELSVAVDLLGQAWATVAGLGPGARTLDADAAYVV